jgi:hypothetical protein
MKCFPELQRLPSGRYRLRRVVPEQLQLFFDGKKNKTYSLGTDKREVIKLAKLKSVEFDMEVDQARAELKAHDEAKTDKTSFHSFRPIAHALLPLRTPLGQCNRRCTFDRPRFSSAAGCMTSPVISALGAQVLCYKIINRILAFDWHNSMYR